MEDDKAQHHGLASDAVADAARDEIADDAERAPHDEHKGHVARPVAVHILHGLGQEVKGNVFRFGDLLQLNRSLVIPTSHVHHGTNRVLTRTR